MPDDGLPMIIRIYSLMSLAVGSLFFYQAITSYISYYSFKLSYGKYLVLLCCLSGLACFGNFAFPYLETPAAKYFNTHLIFSLNYASGLAYMRLMKLYLGLESRHLRMSEQVLQVSLMILGVATAVAACGYETFLLKNEPLQTRSFYINTLNNPYSVSDFTTLFIAPAMVSIVHHYVVFLRHLWRLRRSERLLIAGLLINFVFICNDTSLVTSAFVYAFPLLTFSYFSETLRITSVIQQQSVLKLNELEGEIIQIAQVAELGFLAGNISHDIRNPLALVAGCNYKLRRYLSEQLPADPKWPVVLDKIDQACHRMDKIIESYLFLLHKDSHHQHLQTVNWREVVGEAIALCEQRTGEIKDLKLEVNAAGDLVMQGHDTQLIMILVNLVNNACDAIAGLPAKWIHIDTQQQGQDFVIRITDSGAGIPEAVLKHIFEKRFTTKKRGKGSGLGLDFVKRVVEAHGGSIKVDQHCAHTSFVLTFPAPTPAQMEQRS